jgi:hypothetical protein
MSNEFILSNDDIEKINFLRNEANLEIHSIAAHDAWIGGLTRRKDNFESVREDLPNSMLVDTTIAQINHEIIERQLQKHTSELQVENYAAAISGLISGKTDPKDVIEGAANDIRYFSHLLGQ